MLARKLERRELVIGGCTDGRPKYNVGTLDDKLHADVTAVKRLLSRWSLETCNENIAFTGHSRYSKKELDYNNVLLRQRKGVGKTIGRLLSFDAAFAILLEPLVVIR